MKPVFAYIRVSTTRQGEHGSSLQEQRSAITAYAKREELDIIQWFEETETAAKQGRYAFGQLLTSLLKGQARGVVIHKIDRGARNLKDWANLGDLIDKGVEVHFAHESLDLTSRGGRLSADIQAVVAADFIRNLRQETRKGFYGRLKQGLYPLGAPIGYRDMGRGQVKALDLQRAPLIRQLFELYASGDFNFQELIAEITKRGLQNRNGKPITLNGLTTILNNPFYIGLIHIRKTNEVFQGSHTPIISKWLYDDVQAILRGKRTPSGLKHERLARRLIQCTSCGLHLVGETQKKRYTYYRCHSKDCNTCVPEGAVESAIADALKPLEFDEAELRDLRDLVDGLRATAEADNAHAVETLGLHIRKATERIARLTDAFVDGMIDKEVFEDRKKLSLENLRELRDRIETYQSGTPLADKVEADLELANTAYSLFKNGLLHEKRAMLFSLTSNFSCSGKKLSIELKSPFRELLDWRISTDCDLHRDTPRTRATRIFELLTKITTEEQLRRPTKDSLQSPQSPEVPEWRAAA